jgi:hypothetical protein
VASNNPDVRDLRERMKQYKNCSGRSCPGVELTPSYRGARGPSERRFFIELKPGARAFVQKSERSSLCFGLEHGLAGEAARHDDPP